MLTLGHPAPVRGEALQLRRPRGAGGAGPGVGRRVEEADVAVVASARAGHPCPEPILSSVQNPYETVRF